MLNKITGIGKSARGRDLFLFIVSLLLAFGIWLIHMCSLEYSDIVTVPVIAKSNIEGYSDLSTNQGDIAARCRMSGFRIIRFSRSDTKPVVVEFSAADLKAEGNGVFTITASRLGHYVNQIFGEGSSLESFVTPEVEFRFTRENYKKVPVQATPLLTFKSQYMAVGSLQLKPDSVVVYGEEGILENIDRVMTQPLNKTNISSSIHGFIKLDSPANVRVSESQVNYSLEVCRYVEMRKNVRIKVRNAPAGKTLSVFPSSADAVFRCSFPPGNNPVDGVEFYVDYNEFIKSISGRCIAHPSGLTKSIIDYTLDPQVFDCVENLE